MLESLTSVELLKKMESKKKPTSSIYIYLSLFREETGVKS